VTAEFDRLNSILRHLSGRLAETAASSPQCGPPGCSPTEAVWSKGKAVLYRYLPLPSAKPVRVRPVLISYALVNRPDVLDLQPKRSLVRRLLAAGLQVYLLDWGRPEESDRGLDLADYLGSYLDAGIQHVLKTRRIRSINLLGVCQGGTFSLCYCALYPKRVANLVTMVTPVDFHTPSDLLSKWARNLDTQAIRQMGNVSGSVLTGVFLSMRPFRLMVQKYLELLEHDQDSVALDTFCRMEKWIFDSPDQSANAFAQFVREFYQENRLIRGTLEIGGRRVDLRKIGQPVLNIYAGRDHIVPTAAATALRGRLGTTDYMEFEVDTGHIGMYVSQHTQATVASKIASWLIQHR
jgi:polyhydroxyalkanoate synthase subunit PhaC